MPYNSIIMLSLHYLSMLGILFAIVMLGVYMAKYMKKEKLLSSIFWIFLVSLLVSFVTFGTEIRFMSSMMNGDFEGMMDFDGDDDDFDDSESATSTRSNL